MAIKHITIPELTGREIANFRSKIAPPNENGCEIWKAACDDERGYGVFHINRNNHQRKYRATRVAYFLYYGKQPDEMLVCHNCPSGDNPSCCAGVHLFLGTNRENMQDAKKKGRLHVGDDHYSRQHPERLARGATHGSRTHPERLKRGEQHPHAKLTADKVRQIRAMQDTGTSQTQVGRMFDISRAVVSKIWSRELWTHVQ